MPPSPSTSSPLRPAIKKLTFANDGNSIAEGGLDDIVLDDHEVKSPAGVSAKGMFALKSPLPSDAAVKTPAQDFASLYLKKFRIPCDSLEKFINDDVLVHVFNQYINFIGPENDGYGMRKNAKLALVGESCELLAKIGAYIDALKNEDGEPVAANELNIQVTGLVDYLKGLNIVTTYEDAKKVEKNPLIANAQLRFDKDYQAIKLKIEDLYQQKVDNINRWAEKQTGQAPPGSKKPCCRGCIIQ